MGFLTKTTKKATETDKKKKKESGVITPHGSTYIENLLYGYNSNGRKSESTRRNTHSNNNQQSNKNDSVYPHGSTYIENLLYGYNSNDRRKTQQGSSYKPDPRFNVIETDPNYKPFSYTVKANDNPTGIQSKTNYFKTNDGLDHSVVEQDPNYGKNRKAITIKADEPKTNADMLLNPKNNPKLQDPKDKLVGSLRPLTQAEQSKYQADRDNEITSGLLYQMYTPQSSWDNVKGYSNDYFAQQKYGISGGTGRLSGMSETQLRMEREQNEKDIALAQEKEKHFKENEEQLKQTARDAEELQGKYANLGEFGVPVNGADGTDTTPGSHLKERPEDYWDGTNRYDYDELLYDYLNGAGAYVERLESAQTDEETDALFAEMDDLWESIENGTIETKYAEAMEAYAEANRNTVGDYGSGRLQERNTSIDEELERRAVIDQMISAAPEGTGKYDPDAVIWGLNGSQIDQIYYYANRGLNNKGQSDFEKYGTMRPESFMSAEQLEVFNRYYLAGQKEEAKAFYDALMPYLQEIQAYYKTNLTKKMSQNEYAPLMIWNRITTQPMAGITGTVGTVLALAGNKEAQNPYSPYYDMTRTNQTIQSARAEVWGKQLAEWFPNWGNAEQFGQFLNGVTYSIADNLVAVGLAGGGAGFRAGGSAEKIAEHMIQFIMSSEATASTMLERLDAGYNPTEAALFALGSGGIEAITEKYSIEALLKPDVKELLGKPKELAKYLLKNTVAEGSEEVASDVMGTMLDTVLSYAFDHKTELMQQYDAYLAAHPEATESDALKAVLLDYAGQLGTDFLAGGLSGLLMSGARAGETRVKLAYEDVMLGNKAIRNGTDANTLAQDREDALRELDEGMKAAQEIKDEKEREAKLKELGEQKALLESKTNKQQASTKEAENKIKLMEAGLKMDPKSESYRIASEIKDGMTNSKDDLDHMKKASNRDYGRLVRSIINESNEQIGQIAKGVLESDIVQQLQDAGETKERAQMFGRVLAEAVVTNNMTAESWLTMQMSEKAQEIWKSFKDSDAVKQAKALASEINEVQKSVMQLIMDPRENGISEADAEASMQGAEAASAEDIAEADANGKRSGNANEVIADGKYADITGIERKVVEEKNEKGKTVKQSRVYVTLNDGRSVDIALVKGMNQQQAQVLQFMKNDQGKTIGTNLANALLQTAGTAKNTAGTVSDAMKILWDMRTGMTTAKTNLDTNTEDAIRKAIQADMDAWDAERANNNKKIRPGQGRTTINGAEFGTKEFQQQISKLDKEIRDEANFIGQIAKSAGFEVELYYDPKTAGNQGSFMGGKDGYGIRINLAGTVNIQGAHRSAVATFAHETTHWLEANSPEAYKALRNFVLQNVRKSGMGLQGELRRIMDNYAAHGEEIDLNGAIAEMVAMGSEQVLTNEKVATQLRQQDAKTYGKVQEAVNWIVNQIRKVIGSTRDTSSRYAKAMMNVGDSMARIWLSAYQEALGAEGNGAGIKTQASYQDIESNQKKGYNNNNNREGVTENDEGRSKEIRERAGTLSRRNGWALRGNAALSIVRGNYSAIIAAGQEGYELFREALNGSIYVSRKGEPIIWYHGSEYNFDQFKVQQGKNFVNTGGIYLTSSAKVADYYAKSNTNKKNIYPAGVYGKNNIVFKASEFDHNFKLQNNAIRIISVAHNNATGVKVDSDFLNVLSKSLRKEVSGGRISDNVAGKILDSFAEKGDIDSIAVNGCIWDNGETNNQLIVFDGENIIPATKDIWNKMSKEESKKSYSFQEDNDYMAAVERGDMETAQRMVDEKANEAGYTIPGYHGTSQKFTTFDKSKAGENWEGDSRFGPGFYFAYDRDTALRWTDGMRVVNARLKMDNPLDLRQTAPADLAEVIRHKGEEDLKNYDPSFPISYEEYVDNIERSINRRIENPASFLASLKYDSEGKMTDNISELLKSLGYDGIISDDEMVVFDPEQIKSADPVTYDDDGNIIPLSERFNMENPDIRYSIREDDATGTQLQNEYKAAYDRYTDLRLQESRLKGDLDDFNKRIAASTKEEQDALIEEIQAWDERTGYSRIEKDLKAAEDAKKKAQKALDDYIEQRDVAEEQEKIQASGMNEADWRRSQAVKEFGYTTNFKEAGYLLPNGKMLNFSGEKGKHYGYRGEDHRRIGSIYASGEMQGSAAMNAFMNDGNIRVMAESPGIDIGTAHEPTTAQYNQIRNMAARFAEDEYFNVDLSDERGNVVGNYEYDGRINPSKIVNDIKYFFQNGEVREQSVTSMFHGGQYSIQEMDNDYNAAVNSGDMETAQRMVEEYAAEMGYNIHAYHGTGRADRVGNVFMPERATSGPMAFFTDNRIIAENYARDKKDTSIAYDDEYGDYYNQFRVNIRGKNVPVGKLWNTLNYKEKQKITERAKHITLDDEAENIIYDESVPFGVGNFNDYERAMHNWNSIDTLIDSWLESGTLLDREEDFLDVLKLAGIEGVTWNNPDARDEKVYDTFLKIQNPFVVSDMYNNEFLKDLESWWMNQNKEKYETTGVLSDAWDKRNITVDEWIQDGYREVKEGFTGNWTRIPDGVTDYLKSKGFDGIKDNGGKGGGMGHTVWIPFSSEQIKSADAVTYDDNGNVIPLSERFNDQQKDIRYSIMDETDIDARAWMETVQESSLQTEAEKQLLRDFKALRMKISLRQESERKYQREIAQIEAKPEAQRTKEDNYKLQGLKVRLENSQKIKEQAEEELAKITSSNGYVSMMYRQQRVLNDFMYGRTQEEVRSAVERLEKSAANIERTLQENEKKAAELEKSGIVQQFKKLLGTTTVDQTLAQLKKQYNSTWTKNQLKPYLEPIILKMKAGEDFSQDVETLAGILVNSDSTNTYEELSALRGLVITLGKGAQQELKAQHSSLKEVRARLAGTGIQVKYGERSTLESDIEDLRAEYPSIPDLGDEKDALGNFLDWIDGMKSQSASNEFYDQKLAEAMAIVTQSAAGAAKGIYMPTDAKAQQQVLAMMDFVKGLSAENQKALETLQSVADELGKLRSAGQQATGMVNTLAHDTNTAIDYFNTMAKIAQDRQKQKTRRDLIEQLKSENAQKIAKNNEEWRSLIERDKNARAQAEKNMSSRAKINTVTKRMYNLLKNPQNTKNIPEHMQGLAREILGLLVKNDLSEGSRKVTQITKAQLEDAQRVLNAWTARDGAPDLSSLEEMADSAFARIVINQDLMNLRDGLEDYNREYKGKNKLDTLQQRGEILQRMQEALSEIWSYIRAEGEVFQAGKKTSVINAAADVMRGTKGQKYREWTGKAGRGLAAMHKAIVSGNMTPEYFFRTLGNEGLSALWENYHQAENRNGLELAKAKARLDEIAKKYGYETWDPKKRTTVHLESGDVNMTLGQMMALWATWNREQQLGPEMSEHLTKGGFYTEEQDLREGILGKTTIDKRAHRISATDKESGINPDMQKIESLLTAEQKNYVNDVVSFMSNEMSELGNEASMAAYGIRMYKEKYYFPFQMWDGIKSRKSNESGNAANNDRAFHPSFSKSRLHGANNAIVIGDFTQTAADHIAGMINYATMGLANESLQKVLNQQMIENAEEMGYNGTKRNIRTILEEAYGKEAMSYLNELQVQLNGGAVKTTRTLYDKAISMFRKNAVAGSLSVAAQQPMSYIRAATMISPKYLAKALTQEYWKGAYKERMAHSGVSVIKDMGRFDMNAGQSAREYLMPEALQSRGRKIYEGIAEYATILPEKMDAWTWNRMWVAVKEEQKALHPEMDPKSDEFLDLCGVRFNEIMRRTQVYDSVLVRSENMRSTNPWVKSITSFMAEPTLTLNVLADAVRSAKQGEAGGKALLAKAGATFMMSAIMQSLIKALFSTGRTPDDKKTWFENLVYRFTGNIISEANPFSMIPGYNDLVTLLKDGKLEDDAMGAIGKIWTSGKGLIDIVNGGSEKGIWRDIEDSAGQLAQLFTNIPVKNIMREGRAMYNWLIAQPFAARPTNPNVLKYQTEQALLNADSMLSVALESAGFSTSNTAYYQRIYDAKKAGNQQQAQGMIDYLLNGKGVTQDALSKGIAAAAKKDDGESAADTAGFLISEGLAADDYIRKQYKEGKMTDAEAMKMLREANPKMKEDDAWWAVDRMKYQKETGAKDAPSGTYYRLKDAINENRSDAIKAAVKQLLDHGGEKDKIKSWIGSKSTGFKTAYLEASGSEKVRIKNALIMAYKAVGVSEKDANAIINKWEKDAKKNK